MKFSRVVSELRALISYSLTATLPIWRCRTLQKSKTDSGARSSGDPGGYGLLGGLISRVPNGLMPLWRRLVRSERFVLWTTRVLEAVGEGEDVETAPGASESMRATLVAELPSFASMQHEGELQSLMIE